MLAEGQPAQLPQRALDGFALGASPIPTRELYRVDGNQERVIAVAAVNGQTNVFLIHIADSEIVMLRMPGPGTTPEGIYAKVHSGFRTMTEIDTSRQLRIEQDFWRNWAVTEANMGKSMASPR